MKERGRGVKDGEGRVRRFENEGVFATRDRGDFHREGRVLKV